MKSGSLAPGPSARSEGLAGILLFHATAGFVLWQNSQVAVLYDLGYLLDTGYRISLGQMPYRDFPLVHAPLTFVIQALIMRLAGRVYLLPVAYAAVVGGLGTVVAWRILLRTLAGKVRSAWAVSLLLAAPLTVLGIHGIYPHPIYDCDCAFAILVAILLLLRLDFAGAGVGRRFGGWPRVAIAGAAVVLPVFFKQNMGLAFLAAVVAGVLLLLLLRFAGRGWPRDAPDRPNPAILPRLLGMIAVASFVAILLIQVLVGLKNYVHWTVRFAAERRLPGWADMLAVYRQPSFVWTLPVLGIGSILLHSRLGTRVWGRILTLCLLAAPFVGSIVFLFLDDDLDERADNLLVLWPFLMIAVAVVGFVELRKGFTLARLMPFFVLAAIHGTFLSQQLWGSTYAIWPLLIVLIAYLLSTFPAVSRWVVPALAGVVSVTFLVCGGLYAVGHERLNYVQIPDGPIEHATLPELRGMADRGPYLADFEELAGFAGKEIPLQDALLLLPDEEPFYYATGRVPRFPTLLLDHTTDPYTPAELMETARLKGVTWAIVKRRLQLNADPLPDRDAVMRLVEKEFAPYRVLSGYEIYRRR